MIEARSFGVIRELLLNSKLHKLFRVAEFVRGGGRTKEKLGRGEELQELLDVRFCVSWGGVGVGVEVGWG